MSMTPSYVNALHCVANGGHLSEPDLAAAMASVGASDARFGRDILQYQCAPGTFHEAVGAGFVPSPVGTPKPEPKAEEDLGGCSPCLAGEAKARSSAQSIQSSASASSRQSESGFLRLSERST